MLDWEPFLLAFAWKHPDVVLIVLICALLAHNPGWYLNRVNHWHATTGLLSHPHTVVPCSVAVSGSTGFRVGLKQQTRRSRDVPAREFLTPAGAKWAILSIGLDSMASKHTERVALRPLN